MKPVTKLQSSFIKRISILCIISGVLIGNFTFVESNAQIPPIPPPPPSTGDTTIKDLKISKGDKSPPSIVVITKELKSGKNVVEVQIIDDSDIKVKHIVYVNHGTLNTAPLVEDIKNHYIGLIESLPPSTVIRVDATDAALNTATVYKQIIVLESNDLFSNFSNWIKKIFSPA